VNGSERPGLRVDAKAGELRGVLRNQPRVGSEITRQVTAQAVMANILSAARLPAISDQPLALRPSLSTGLPFRG
jgi:hypothetical protein